MGLTTRRDTFRKAHAYMWRRAAVKVHDEPKSDQADDIAQDPLVKPRVIGRLPVHRGGVQPHYYSFEARRRGRRGHSRQNAAIPSGQGEQQSHLDEQLEQS